MILRAERMAAPALLVIGLVLMVRGVVGGSSKINAVSLLLPLDRSDSAASGAKLLSVSTSLTASPGCYDWSSSNPDVVDVVESSIEYFSENTKCEYPLASRVTITVTGNMTPGDEYDAPSSSSTSAVSSSNDGKAVGRSGGGNSGLDNHCEMIAFDPSTGEQLAVEVYTHAIHHIEIRTTTRRLELFEPQTVEVQAFDAKGNDFSSLDGLSFSWETNIAANGGSDHGSPLLIKKISETQVATSPGLQQEYFGRFGYKVQVAGVRAGRGMIRATLARPYGGLADVFAEVEIDVVEPLSLCPASPMLVTGSWLNMVAMRKKSKTEFETIQNNDNGHYEWIIRNKNGNADVLKVDSESGALAARRPGTSTLVFQQYGYETNFVTSHVKVVPLDALSLWFAPFQKFSKEPQMKLGLNSCSWAHMSRFPQDRALPHRKEWTNMDLGRWVMTLGKRYYVMTTLSSAAINSTQTIFVTPTMQFDFAALQVASDVDEGGALMFVGEDEYKANLASVKIVEATRVGFVDIDVNFAMGAAAPFDSPEDDSDEDGYDGVPRSIKKRVQITDTVGLIKEIIRLPVDPINQVFHSYTVAATGGTGFYTYQVIPSTSGGSTRSVVGMADSYKGVVVVRENVAAKDLVEVRDTFDEHNAKIATVLVSVPSGLRFDEEHVYAAIADEFEVPAFFASGDGKPYDNCTGFNDLIEWEVDNELSGSAGNVVEMIKGKQLGPKLRNPAVCSSRKLRALKSGGATVTVRYSDKLIATLRITVSEKVKIVNPTPNPLLDARNLPVALMLVGQSTTLTVAGGKLRDNMVVSFLNENNENVIVQPAEWPTNLDISKGTRDRNKQRSYQVRCVKEGKFEILIQDHARTVFICAYPKQLKLELLLGWEEREAFEDANCAEESEEGQLIVPRYHIVNEQLQAYPLRVVLLDAQGRSFTDLGSLHVNWRVEPANERELSWISAAGSGLLTASRGFETPALVVFAELLIPPLMDRDEMRFVAGLSLNVVDDIGLEPGVLRAGFADPSAELSMGVTGGSEQLLEQGRLECKSSRNDVALVSLARRRATVQYVPDDAGNGAQWQFRSTDLKCQMACLVGSMPTTTHADFSRVGRLHIQAPSKVKNGEVAVVRVQAFDAAGRPFSADMHDFIGLHLGSLPEGSFEVLHSVDVADCNDSSSDDNASCDGGWSVEVRGRLAGSAVLRAESGDRLMAAEQNIIVYRGIEIVPSSDRVIEPGVTFRLNRAHGPFADPSRCAFHLDDGEGTLETIDEKAGLFYASKLGTTVVTAVCRDEKSERVIDKAQLEVQVRFLKEMSLVPSLVFVPQGKAMRVRVGFPEVLERSLNFDAFEREFEWSVADDGVAEILSGPREDSLNSNMYSVWVKGLAPGTTTLRVVSRCNTELAKRLGLDSTLVAEAAFAVEHALEFTEELVTSSTAKSAATLLMPRHGQLRIATSLDQHWQQGTLEGKSTSLSYFVSVRGPFGSGGSSNDDDTGWGSVSSSCSGSSPNYLTPIRVTEDGIVTSGGLLGSADLVVELRSEFRGQELVQHIAAHIVVAEVAFVGVQQLHHELLFPVGISRTLEIGLFDANGRAFTAPFSTLDLNVAVGDAAKLSIEPQHHSSSQKLRAFQVLAAEEGRANLVISLVTKKHHEELAREEYLKLRSISASSAFHFQFLENKLVVVPGDTVEVFLAASSALFLSEGVPVRCAVVLNGVSLQASIEASPPNMEGEPWAVCKFTCPSSATPTQPGAEAIVATLTLFAANEEVHSVTRPVTFAFRLDSKQVHIEYGTGGGSFEWDLSMNRVELEVIGLADASLVSATTNAPSLVKVLPSSSGSSSSIVLQRAQNGTCDRTAVLAFVNKANAQRMNLEARFTCVARGAAPAKRTRSLLSALFSTHSIHLQTTIVATVVMLALLCWVYRGRTGPLSTAITSAGNPKDSVSFRGMDHPSDMRRAYPRLVRDQGLGSPLRNSPVRFRTSASPFN